MGGGDRGMRVYNFFKFFRFKSKKRNVVRAGEGNGVECRFFVEVMREYRMFS